MEFAGTAPAVDVMGLTPISRAFAYRYEPVYGPGGAGPLGTIDMESTSLSVRKSIAE
jgi:hypothetical protein